MGKENYIMIIIIIIIIRIACTIIVSEMMKI